MRDKGDLTMIIQQKCPICEGHGLVQGGFYNSIPCVMSISSNCTEVCRNCSGSGVVYVEQGENQ
jgi:hypothetical protein